jgi:hypothetical protein
MIFIPSNIKLKLIELDKSMQELGRSLYGRKLFGSYEESGRFQNFQMELHSDGSFTLHFKRNILGHMEQKHFDGGLEASARELVIDELTLTITLIQNKLKLVSA